MPWALLLDLRVLLGAALISMGIYAKILDVRLQQEKAEYAQFRADVESEAAKAKVRNAQERAQQAINAQEALSDLQDRNAALNRRYERLRASSSGGVVPSLSSAAASLGSCPGNAVQPYSPSGLLAEIESRVTAILKAGDLEIAKYGELWDLGEANATKE